MADYTVTGGKVVVRATSSLHDTVTTWARVAGEIRADPDRLADPGGAAVTVAVDMTDLSAGDFLRNRKLKKDLDVAAHPEATFRLARVVEVTRDERTGAFEARAEGTLAWRGREVTLEVTGTGTIDDRHVDAQAAFSLDVTTLGVKPPRFLMLKVAEVVAVTVEIRATMRS
ncbi:MAG TPA: YceI family protein [Kofleriaceae bacterium]|nr:YceI family protein [Kofleriaceae bacterium]